jgi:hypothetical protein
MRLQVGAVALPSHDEASLVTAGNADAASDLPAVAIFASGKAPGQIILQTHDLAHSWRDRAQAVISGFHSPLEEEVWDVLWPDAARGLGGVILVKVLARSMLKQLPAGQHAAIGDNRLVLVSPFPAAVRRATRRTAYHRNLVAAALADAVLILHAHRDSSTFKLAREVLSWGKNVYTLDVPANQPLLDIGVGRFEETLALEKQK